MKIILDKLIRNENQQSLKFAGFRALRPFKGIV